MDIDPKLLEKYGQNRCTPEERLLVEQWLNAGVPKRSPFSEELWSGKTDLWRRINDHVTEPGLRSGSTRNRPSWFRIQSWSAAAIFLLFVGCCWLFFNQTNFSERPLLVNKLPIYDSLQTLPGQRAQLVLSDGTQVKLNAGSTLWFPRTFSGKVREVSLQGEAYFTVAKDPSHTFVVHGPHSTVTVLGTSFNLRNYTDEGGVSVNVTSGRVSLADPGSGKYLVLNKYEEGILDEKGLFINKKSAAEEKRLWIDGYLSFDNQLLQEVFYLLEREYGVSIQVENKQLEKKIYYGEFQHASLTDILQSLAFAFDFKYELKNKTVRIY